FAQRSLYRRAETGQRRRLIGAPSCALPIFAARHGGRLQQTERCATHGSLFLPLAAVAVRASCALPIFAARHGGRLQKTERCASRAFAASSTGRARRG